MASDSFGTIKWRNLGIVPTSGMLFWNTYVSGESAAGAAYDQSGNSRDIVVSGTNPVLQENIINGNPAWYFDGTNTSPMKSIGALTIKHLFILGGHDGAAFNLNRGLVTGVTSGDLLISNSSGTNWFDFTSIGIGSASYYKSGTNYANTAAPAPMNKLELMEVVASGGITPDGVQVGQQRDLAGRIWKGWFADMIGFDRVLTGSDLRRVYLYYNLRYAVHKAAASAISLYFPTKDLLPLQINNRYHAMPVDWNQVTEETEYEDRNKDFNQFSDNPPRRWEYQYDALTKDQVTVHRVFNDTARRSTPFKFKDNDGYVWSNVYIDAGGFNVDHEDHKRWKSRAAYQLIGFGSTSTYEG